MPDLPEISDEMVEGLAQAMRDTNLPDVWDPQLPQRVPMGVFACVALDWLVASGWRPEADVLREVAAERERQDAKWGVQNHPDGTGGGNSAAAAVGARLACQLAAKDGGVSWRHIMREEVAEAFAETDPKALRAELLQVAAVAVAWAEAIDRRDPATALEPARPLPVADGSGIERESIEDAQENDRCGICGSVEHFREDHRG